MTWKKGINNLGFVDLRGSLVHISNHAPFLFQGAVPDAMFHMISDKQVDVH